MRHRTTWSYAVHVLCGERVGCAKSYIAQMRQSDPALPKQWFAPWAAAALSHLCTHVLQHASLRPGSSHQARLQLAQLGTSHVADALQ
jgi:hypothetical protein